MSYLHEFVTEGSGDYINDVAGEALTKHALVYRSNADTWLLADADAVATMPVIGITLAAIPSGNKGRILIRGYVADTAWTWITGGSNGKIYASTTPGVLTQTPPSGVDDTIEVVAVAFFSNGIWFDPGAFGSAGQGCAILPGATAYVGSDECLAPYGNYFYTGDYATHKLVIEAACAYAGALGGGVVHLEPMTYTAAVVVDEAEIILEGEGWDTFINGGTTGHAISITGSGDRVVVRDLRVQTTQAGTNAYNAINSAGDDVRIDNVYVSASDQDGIEAGGPRTIITGCLITNCDDRGILFGAAGDDSIAGNNIIDTTGDDGILINAAAENCVVEGNRISGWTGEPIDDNSDTSVVADNNCGGDVMNSKGCSFATVQEAIDHLAGDGWVEVPDGTFAEAVTITDDDMILRGRGWASIIDGGTTGHAISVSGTRCVVRDLTAQTDVGQGNAYDALRISGTYCRVVNVRVNGSDQQGMNILAGWAIVEKCFVFDADDFGIIAGATGDNLSVTETQIDTSGNDGIAINALAETCVITDNRISGWTGEPIDDDSDTSIVADNNCGGDVMNSKGCAFSTVQAAIDHLAGDGWVEVPDGTFVEAVTITDADVVLRGRGWGSVISGGTLGHAIAVSGARCIIKDLQVGTSPGQGNNFHGISSTGADVHILNVWCSGSDGIGFLINGARNSIKMCRVSSTDGNGIDLNALGDDTIVGECHTNAIGGTDILIDANGENCIVTSNRCTAGTITDNSGTSTVANNDTT